MQRKCGGDRKEAFGESQIPTAATAILTTVDPINIVVQPFHPAQNSGGQILEKVQSRFWCTCKKQKLLVPNGAS